jgi:hypothetical protein
VVHAAPNLTDIQLTCECGAAPAACEPGTAAAHCADVVVGLQLGDAVEFDPELRFHRYQGLMDDSNHGGHPDSWVRSPYADECE